MYRKQQVLIDLMAVSARMDSYKAILLDITAEPDTFAREKRTDHNHLKELCATRCTLFKECVGAQIISNQIKSIYFNFFRFFCNHSKSIKIYNK